MMKPTGNLIEAHRAARLASLKADAATAAYGRHLTAVYSPSCVWPQRHSTLLLAVALQQLCRHTLHCSYVYTPYTATTFRLQLCRVSTHTSLKHTERHIWQASKQMLLLLHTVGIQQQAPSQLCTLQRCRVLLLSVAMYHCKRYMIRSPSMLSYRHQTKLLCCSTNSSVH